MSEKNAVALPPTTETSLIEIIANAMRDPSVDVAKLQAVAQAAGPMLDAQDRILRAEREIAFNKAFFRLRRRLPRIPKNGIVNYEDKKTGDAKKAFNFAKWEDIDSYITPLLDDEGFGLTFESTERTGGGMIITGHLLHEAGHFRSASIPLPIDTSGGKSNLQGAGSSMSYGKRYCTTMLLNLVFEGQDDDGQRGGMEFADEEDQAQITQLLEQTGTEPESFLRQFFEVSAIGNLPKSATVAARNMLLTKLTAQQKRKTPPQ